MPQDSYNPTENNSATDILNSSRCNAILKQYPIFVPTVYQPPEDIEDHHLLNKVNDVLSPIDISFIQSCSTTTPLSTNFSSVQTRNNSFSDSTSEKNIVTNLPASPDEIVVAEPAVQETRKRRRRSHEEKKTYSKGKHPILPAKEYSKSCKNNVQERI